MSALAVGDFIVNNLLDDLEMNPTWEKWRRYFFAACVATSLLPLYLTLSGVPVHCFPADENGTVIEGAAFSATEAARVNTLCSIDSSLTPLRFCGCILMVINVILLLISSFWLHSSDVIDGFRTFSKCRDLILKRNETMDQMKGVISSPLPEENVPEKLASLREACRLILLVTPRTDICRWYFYRNIVLLVCQTGSMIGAIIITYRISSIGPNFICAQQAKSYTCSNNIGVTTALFSSAFAIGVFLQIIVVSWGLKKTAPCCFRGKSLPFLRRTRFPCSESCGCCRGISSQFERCDRNVIPRFMVELWQNSQPSNSKILRDVLEYLYSKEFSDSVKVNCREILDKKDIELLQLREKTSTEGFPEIINDFTSPKYEFKKDFLKNVLKTVYYEVDHCHKFMEWAVREKFWDILVLFLNFANNLQKSSNSRKQFFQSLKINFNSYGCHSEGTSANSEQEIGNVFYYAINADSKNGEETLWESDSQNAEDSSKTSDHENDVLIEMGRIWEEKTQDDPSLPNGPIAVLAFLIENSECHVSSLNRYPYVHFCKIGVDGDKISKLAGVLEEMSKNIRNKSEWSYLKNKVGSFIINRTICQDEIMAPNYIEEFPEDEEKTDESENDLNRSRQEQFLKTFTKKKFEKWDDGAIKVLEYANKRANDGSNRSFHWTAVIAILNAFIHVDAPKLPNGKIYPDIKIERADNDLKGFAQDLVKAFVWKSPLGYISRGAFHIIGYITKKDVKKLMKGKLEAEMRKQQDESDKKLYLKKLTEFLAQDTKTCLASVQTRQ